MLRGEVWLINLDPMVGAEISKTRPAVIVSEDAIGILPLRVVVPLTEWWERYAVAPWLVRVEPDQDNNPDKPSVADALQVDTALRLPPASRSPWCRARRACSSMSASNLRPAYSTSYAEHCSAASDSHCRCA